MFRSSRVPGIALLFFAVAAAAGIAHANTEPPIPSYYSSLRFNLTSPSAYVSSTAGFYNPAAYGMLDGGEIIFSWSDKNNQFTSMDQWGLYFGGKNLGFATQRSRVPLQTLGEGYVNDNRLGLAWGNRNTTIGYGFGWTTADKNEAARSTLLQAGVVQRFGRFGSMGLVGTFATEKGYQQGLIDLAVRPFGTPVLTMFADGELPTGVALKDAPYSVGAMVEPVPGFQFIGRYFEDETYSLSVGFVLGGLGIRGTPNYDKDNNTASTNYEIRTGYPRRSFFEEAITKNRQYLKLSMHGNVTYRRYRFFDDESLTLNRILTDLEYARKDPSIRGVAIYMGGMHISRGKAWEIREKLWELQEDGKHVVVFVESMGMTEYHLASVADHIIMDPEGMVVIPGYVMGRTFVKDMLTKIGIGFDEWRFFKYKSAAEAFSRTSMSEADREQRYHLIEDLYATVRSDVAKSRNVSEATFDEWVNKQIFMSAAEAEKLGLIDQVGRWDDVDKAIEELEGKEKRMVSRRWLAGNRYPPEHWGEDPEIAVVYALGECAMESGINARRLEALLRKIERRRNIKAVVLRVDSPGGSSMASDAVAEQLKKIKKKKPVIISQGDVAASGGYWLSMYGDSIFALPGTITGSIGVIGGWVWDDGVGEKIGHTSDFVKVGEKADYNAGIRLLLYGPMLPRKNLDPEDRERVKTELLNFYGTFLDKVSKGRGIPRDEVDAVAQGQVFSGIDGIDKGLVDEIGGLDAAIEAARVAAGIPDGRPYKVAEYPEMPAFDFAALRPFKPILARLGLGAGSELQDVKIPEGLEWTYIRTLFDNPGRPLVMLPPEYYVEEGSISDK